MVKALGNCGIAVFRSVDRSLRALRVYIDTKIRR
jgi:hypothetical protein